MPPKRKSEVMEDDGYDPDLDETTSLDGDTAGESFQGYTRQRPSRSKSPMAAKRTKKDRPVYFDVDRNKEVNGVMISEHHPVGPYGYSGDNKGDNTAKFIAAQEQYEKAAVDKILRWKKGRGVTEVEGITLKEHQQRPMYTHEPAAAQANMEKFEELWQKGEAKAWATSHLWRDKDGAVLATMYGLRHPGPKFDPSLKHEVTINETMPQEGMEWDGLEPHIQEYIALETQHMMHYGKVQKDPWVDKRHRTDGAFAARYKNHYTGVHADRIRFTSERPPMNERYLKDRHGVYEERRKEKEAQATRTKAHSPPLEMVDELGPPLEYIDKVGAVHYDRCWTEQGHEECKLVRSTDLAAGGSATSRYMTKVNPFIQRVLTPHMVACATTGEYKGMRKVFRAASLDKEEQDGYGFHTGQVVVYNEVLHQHLDGADSGLCLTFCTGSSKGGLMYFPNLGEDGTAVIYSPGTVFVFRSALLFHGVTSWETDGNITTDGRFPGRVEYVLYTKKKVYDRLKNKKPGYLRSTAYETAPEAAPSSRVQRDDQQVHMPYGHDMYAKIINLGKNHPPAHRSVKFQVLPSPLPKIPPQSAKPAKPAKPAKRTKQD